MPPTREQSPTSSDAPTPATPAARRVGVLQRLGIPGKLIFAFGFVMFVGLAASCWLFAYQSRLRLEDIMGEQARQISFALALASKPSLEAGEVGELRQISQDLLKSR